MFTQRLRRIHVRHIQRRQINPRFLEVNDGSCLANLQIVADAALSNYESEVKKLPVGASVTSVTAGGPAEAAGLKSGDIITAVDEVKLDDAHPLLQVLVTQFRPAQRVTLILSRQGAATQVQAGSQPLPAVSQSKPGSLVETPEQLRQVQEGLEAHARAHGGGLNGSGQKVSP